ncbi:MAG: hypothetical protein GY749_44115 [Desulfobacteraceae bacterium]|nr:hypothetical protein [Desulfobacteraceae bacterium]
MRVSDYKSYLPLSVSALIYSLGLFFISYFGDAYEVGRHVLPALFIMALSGVLFIFSVTEVLCRLIKPQALIKKLITRFSSQQF